MNIIISPMSGFICPKCEKIRENLQMKTIFGENLFMCKKCWDKFHFELINKEINEKSPSFGFDNEEELLDKIRRKLLREKMKEL
jgi:hypothetical protein